MRHQKKGRKLSRKRDQRRALLKNLANNLIRYKKIKTTEAKAKELRPFIEKIISKGRKNNLHNKKLIISKLGAMSAKKIFEEIAPRYKTRMGGYTRIIKLPSRKGDASRMAIIELI
ncbi:MAG: 50S ribosomal protein L17 [Patescibacteria group bacterium]